MADDIDKARACAAELSAALEPGTDVCPCAGTNNSALHRVKRNKARQVVTHRFTSPPHHLAYTTTSHANVRTAACSLNPSDVSSRSITTGECTNERNGLRTSPRKAFSMPTTARTGHR